ncbi:putative glutamyl-tRNA(gln) amidotransferase subunit A, partial [Aspergillus nomiae NRRL 13137]
MSITETSAENLVVSRAAGDLTSTAVTNVLLRRAAIAPKEIREDANIVKILLDACVVLDPSLHQNSWRDNEPHIYRDRKKSITVGLVWDDGVVKSTPPVARALQETVESLKALSSDVEVIEWKPYQQREGSESLLANIAMKTRFYTPDGGKAFAKNLALSGGSCLPLLACTLRDTHGAEELIVHGVREWTLKREMFHYSYFQEWNSVAPEMDVILCSAYSTPAPLLDTLGIHIHLGFRDAKDTTYMPRKEFNTWYHEHYDARKQPDAPVCLHLVAKIFKDDKVVQVLEVVKEKI